MGVPPQQSPLFTTQTSSPAPEHVEKWRFLSPSVQRCVLFFLRGLGICLGRGWQRRLTGFDP
eukprot:353200-Amphidinium_carterae.1